MKLNVSKSYIYSGHLMDQLVLVRRELFSWERLTIVDMDRICGLLIFWEAQVMKYKVHENALTHLCC